MNSRSIDRLLAGLEGARGRRGDQAGVESILAALERARVLDAPRLIRLHEALLYFRAFPARPGVAKRAGGMLGRFCARVEDLRDSGGDGSPFDDPEVSGIAGTSVTLSFSFEMLRWLERRCGASLRIAWESSESGDRLGETLPRFLPLLGEEALADANVPYASWVRAARGRSGEIGWLLRRFEGLPREIAAELFDSLDLPVEWKLGRLPLSRTALRLPSGTPFCHGSRLVSGRDVRIGPVLAGPRLAIETLSRRGAERAQDAARAALASRYRELHGFTHADPRTAVRARGSRGIGIYLFGLRRERRLPIRGGFAHLVTRNGVPIGYGDCLALFERVDLSFNIFPEYRDGESAFIFATLLKLYNQVLGATTFSIEPYQIGADNEEAIASGAFWFYRRLGFRPASPELERLAGREEARIAADKSHRTSAAVLRRLAGSNMILDTRDSRPGDSRPRDWDRFHIRNLGLAVQREMARRGQSAGTFRDACCARAARVLKVRIPRAPVAFRAFSDLALVLDRIPDLARWSRNEKDALRAILKAKSALSERRYVRLLGKHWRLRSALLRIGGRLV